MSADERDAVNDSGVAGTTAMDRMENRGVEAGVAPGERHDASPGDQSKVGDARPDAREPAVATGSLWDTFDAMEACLANNSPSARRRAQFRNVMESLILVARQQAGEAIREARTAPPTPSESVLAHLRRRGTA